MKDCPSKKKKTIKIIVDWGRAFWHIIQEPEFCQIWDLHRNINSNINFGFRKFDRKSFQIM